MPGSVLKAGARKLIIKNSPRLLFISIVYVFLITVVFEFSIGLPFGIIVQNITDKLAVGELPNFEVLSTSLSLYGFALAFIFSFVRPVLNLCFISFCLKTNRSLQTEFKDLFKGFQYLTKVILIYLLIAVFVFLWSLIFIFPGIVASYRYRLAYYIFLDDPRKSALQCITESRIMMHGNKLDLMILDLSFLGWYFIDFIVALLIPLPFSVPVVSIWLSPYATLTRVAFYENQVVSVAV